MLYRIIGKSGSGKTRLILSKIKECVLSKKQCTVIVPEQQSVAYERMLSEALGDSFNMYCEVLNFERLPNRVSREYGGLTANYMDTGSRNVLLAAAVLKVQDKLSEYGSVASDNDFICKTGQFIANLKTRGITAQMLDTAADNMGDCRLKGKLKDISLILNEYSALTPADAYDPNDALTHLAAKKECFEFFKNKRVFIDSYYTYTPQETDIIRIILDSANSVYISCLVGEDPELYRENLISADSIKKYADKTEDTVLLDNKRALDGGIEYIQDNLWEPTAIPYGKKTDAVKIASASDTFEEAAAVSSIIHGLIREGYRFRDITVITSDASKYDGILDTVLSSDGIPCYMSVKDELSTKPVVSFVLSALEIAATDFAPFAVDKYIKNSFCGLSVKERDMLSRYAQTWGIRGKRWYDGRDWMMNPAGYTNTLTEYSARMLSSVNRARDKMMNILQPVYETLIDPQLTVKSGVEALYQLLISAKADKRLLARSRQLLEQGKERESEILGQIWDGLIDIFDRLASVLGERQTDPRELYRFLDLMIRSRKVGAIPTAMDSVTVGNAELIRPDGCRACILIGVNEGQFPKAAHGGGLIDDNETAVLEKLGIELDISFFRKLTRERFYFTVAAASPSEKLYITYPRGNIDGEIMRPSSAIMRIKQLLDVSETRFGDKETDKLYCIESARRNLGGIKNPYILDSISGLIKQGDADYALCVPEARIELDRNVLYLTPSRTDKYAGCAFSFFARYLLKLQENKKAAFAAPEIGTFVHSILEEFVSSRTENGVFTALDEADANAEVERLTDRYILSVAGEYAADKRFSYAVNRFKRTLKLIIKNISNEFSQSSFCPSGFEVKIGYGDGLPPVEIPTEKGTVMISGIVDRTDTCVIDGKTYLRVVDYKTGSKKFDLKKIEKGIDLQMLMYLFACCAADKSGNTLPAGVLYMPASAPALEDKEYADIEQAAANSFKKSGLVLADTNVIRAMEQDGGGVFIPTRLNTDGSISAKSSSAKTLEEFEALEIQLKKTLRSMGERLMSGDMAINPIEDKDVNPCAYCEFKSFCRNDKKRKGRK